MTTAMQRATGIAFFSLLPEEHYHSCYILHQVGHAYFSMVDYPDAADVAHGTSSHGGGPTRSLSDVKEQLGTKLVEPSEAAGCSLLIPCHEVQNQTNQTRQKNSIHSSTNR